MKEVAISIHATDDFSLESLEGIKDYDYFHIDVMDGKFVKSKKKNLDIFNKLKNYTDDPPIIGHFMVVDPLHYFKQIIDFIDIFTFHIEANDQTLITIKQIKEFNKRVGIAINPETEVNKIIPYIDLIDLVLIMGVHPGYSGQTFIPETTHKVEELLPYKEDFNFKIEVDGGINLMNAKKLKCDIISSASTIFNAENPNYVINQLKERL
jgi:ribulose-phosphate 3-epimerase